MSEDEWYTGLSREEKERYDEELEGALADADEERTTKGLFFTRRRDQVLFIDDEMLEGE